MCLKSTIKTPEQLSTVFIVKLGHFPRFVLVFLLMALNK